MLANPLTGIHPSLQVVTGMIAPAILILAAGSLVSSTLVRIGRIVDYVRALIARGQEMRRRGNDAAARIIDQQLDVLLRRADLARRALIFYYVAISLFLLSSLLIALSVLVNGPFTWLGPAVVMAGGAFLLAASATLLIEVNLSSGSTRQEVKWYRMGAFDPAERTAVTAERTSEKPSAQR